MKQMNSTLVVDGPMRDDHLGLKGWVKSRKAFVKASPLVLGPRIPDFLSRLVTLSNFMRLSLRESRIRVVASAASRKSGQRWCELGAHIRGPHQLEGKTCGIPHLAKNERDVGHPAIVAGIEPKKRSRVDDDSRQRKGYVDAT